MKYERNVPRLMSAKVQTATVLVVVGYLILGFFAGLAQAESIDVGALLSEMFRLEPARPADLPFRQR